MIKPFVFALTPTATAAAALPEDNAECEQRLEHSMTWEKFFSMESERLLIRLATRDDRELLAPLLEDKQILSKYLLLSDRRASEFEMQSLLDHVSRGLRMPPWGKVRRSPETKLSLIVLNRRTGDTVGMAMLARYPDHKHWKLGFAIAEPYRHQGYARETVGSLIHNVKLQQPNAIFWGHVMNGNLPSIQVLQSLGFVRVDWPSEVGDRRPNTDLFELAPGIAAD